MGLRSKSEFRVTCATLEVFIPTMNGLDESMQNIGFVNIYHNVNISIILMFQTILAVIAKNLINTCSICELTRPD